MHLIFCKLKSIPVKPQYSKNDEELVSDVYPTPIVYFHIADTIEIFCNLKPIF